MTGHFVGGVSVFFSSALYHPPGVTGPLIVYVSGATAGAFHHMPLSCGELKLELFATVVRTINANVHRLNANAHR